MYSGEDLERFYFQYQTEGLPKGVSMQQFCNQTKVPYNLFYKWYKDTRKQVVSVKVDGHPSEVCSPSVTPTPSHPEPSIQSAVQIFVDLRMSNGLYISQKRISYQDLVTLVKKLEVLC